MSDEKTTIELLIKPIRGWSAPGHTRINICRAPPFFRTGYGRYTHRVRSGRHYLHDGVYSHSSFDMWCGQVGFVSKKRPHSEFFSELPDRFILCATCEGRATGAGMLGARKINGKPVMYAPRIETAAETNVART